MSQMMFLRCGSTGAGISYTPPLDALAAKVLTAAATFRLFTGNAEALRVRESGGSTEADIGTLVTGGFDTASFNTHVGGGSGFAAKAYDQNGSSDFVRATAGSQPQVNTASGINSLAGLVFDGTKFVRTANLTWTDVWTDGFEFWCLVRPTNMAAAYRALGARGLYAPEFYIRNNATSLLSIYTGGSVRVFNTTLTANTTYLVRFYYHDGVWRADLNGVTEATTHTVAAESTIAAPFTLGNDGGSGDHLIGQMSCAILFKEALTAPEAAALTTFLKTMGGIA